MFQENLILIYLVGIATGGDPSGFVVMILYILEQFLLYLLKGKMSLNYMIDRWLYRFLVDLNPSLDQFSECL